MASVNRKRLGLAVLTGTVALAAGGVAPASAGVPPGTTAVEVFGGGQNGGQTYVYGRVSASPPKCSRDRTVELQQDPGSGFAEVDTGTSSRRGYFAVATTDVSAGPLRAVVRPKRISTKDGEVTCQRAVGNIAT